MHNPQLTKRQAEILSFVRAKVESQHFPPSFREICSHFGFTLNAVTGHFAALEKKGYIERHRGKSRAITIL